MVYTPDSVVVDVDPDMTADQFATILQQAGSPAAAEALAGFRAVVEQRVSPAFALAVFHHESQFGHAGLVPEYELRNPGATRSTRTGDGEVIRIPGRGPFVRYPSWTYGWRDLAYRLVDPDFVYAQEGRRTIRQIIERWAPASDGNAPSSYINAVVRDMNAWVEEESPMYRVALSAGHRNTDGGGTAGEYEKTPALTLAIARKLRQVDSLDVRVVQGETVRDYPGGLYEAARQVVQWHHEGWRPDVFLEVHFEGNGAGDSARGSFAIYPDWGDDVDVDVRDTLGPMLATRVQNLTGLPQRGNGVMSERRTGVGSQGHRLGVFRATEEIKATCTRLIYEYGALTSPADREIIDGSQFMDQAARATADAIAAFAGIPREPQQEIPEGALVPPHNPLGAVAIVAGFRGRFETVGAAIDPADPIAGALSMFGWPLAPEYPTSFGSAQLFERVILKWIRENAPPFDIVVALRTEEIPERVS